MQILIRAINVKPTDSIKRYLRSKILKYEMLVTNSSVAECTLEKKGGPKRDGNCIVHFSMRLPGVKKPLFVKSKALPTLEAAIDMADTKLCRVVDKYIELKKFDGKRHRYYLSKLSRVKNVKALPRGLWRKLRRKRSQ